MLHGVVRRDRRRVLDGEALSRDQRRVIDGEVFNRLERLVCLVGNVVRVGSVCSELMHRDSRGTFKS